ncbi:hypothetical protein HZS_3905 [Henneguya salminicola]|nr:hypothetical protein HZS_3905 [Henneguya salminicola]
MFHMRRSLDQLIVCRYSINVQTLLTQIRSSNQPTLKLKIDLIPENNTFLYSYSLEVEFFNNEYLN